MAIGAGEAEPVEVRARLWCDPLYGLALAAALPAVALIAATPAARLALHWPGLQALWLMAGLMPVLEEVVFRFGLHDCLAARWSARVGPLTLANAITAVVFGMCHLWTHPPAWALATVLPALVFGWAYERHRRLAAPVLLHAGYNAVYLCLLTVA
ncbi:JDVT-CTERM system glutamic-type intramembrane protease [Salinisphaera sp. T31B1]|uniref:JDVT-CTERM system glutamic-type intramembrane protease MrtJ n=1 Tax=Salinisphaera sp. T31B1 TaxID=727963 RepID=UPI003342621C